MLISEKINSEIYSHILEHLDEILLISETEAELKNNIKLFTYCYLIESNNIYFIEGFSDISDTVKTAFWSTTLTLWTGKISLTNWIVGITSDFISGKGFNIAGSLFLNIISKITGRTMSGVGHEAMQVINLQLLRITTLLLFPSVLLGLVIYRLVTYKDIQLVKNFEWNLMSALETLELSNKYDLSSIFKNINTKYNSILSTMCSTQLDKSARLKCASNHYVKYITEDILTLLIKEYVIYSKKYNINLTHIITFQDLLIYDINRNSMLSKRLALVYEFYIKLIDKYVFDTNSKKYYINLLDNTVRKYIAEIYK